MTNLLGFSSKHFVSIFVSAPPCKFAGQLYVWLLLDWNKEKAKHFKSGQERVPIWTNCLFSSQIMAIISTVMTLKKNVLSCALNLFYLIFLSCLGLFLFYLQLISFLNTDLIVFSAYKNTAVLRAYWISVGEERRRAANCKTKVLKIHKITNKSQINIWTKT